MSDPEDASQWQAEDVISRGYKHDRGGDRRGPRAIVGARIA